MVQNNPDLQYLIDNLTEAEKWGQLAEECAELSQSCLKMQRLYMDNNHPRKSTRECADSVVEEHADVSLCFKVLKWNDKALRADIEDRKLARWASIIRKAKGDSDNG